MPRSAEPITDPVASPKAAPATATPCAEGWLVETAKPNATATPKTV